MKKLFVASRGVCLGEDKPSRSHWILPTIKEHLSVASGCVQSIGLVADTVDEPIDLGVRKVWASLQEQSD